MKSIDNKELDSPWFVRALSKVTDWAEFIITELAEFIMRLFSQICDFAAIVLTIVLMIIGIVCICFGIKEVVVNLLYPTPASHAIHNSVNQVLYGLEFMFLAPLPFALSRAIWIWLPEISEMNYGTGLDKNRNAEAAVTKIKVSTFMLMAAVVATEMVSMATGEPGLTYQATLCGGLLISVLVTASWLLKSYFTSDEVGGRHAELNQQNNNCVK